MIFVLLLIVIIFLIFLINIRVVPHSNIYIIERLGKYLTNWDPGFHFLIPFFDRITTKVSLKEQIFDLGPQNVITKDNVNIRIDSIISFQIIDPKEYTYSIDSPLNAIENIVATSLRNIISNKELDASLSSREEINDNLKATLESLLLSWGIKVNTISIKNIILPDEIQIAMEKEMKAEREKRETILLAEGKKTATILLAQGEKEAQLLAAESKKEIFIKEYEGKAKALELLKEADIDDKVLLLKALESFEKIANGQATKIIIPSDIQNILNLSNISSKQPPKKKITEPEVTTKPSKDEKVKKTKKVAQ